MNQNFSFQIRPANRVNYSIIYTAIRERVAGEITPVSAEQSKTKDNDEVTYGAGNAIDRNKDTLSSTFPGPDGKSWLKINLGKVYCVEQVIWFNYDGSPFLTWTCTSDDCRKCTGNYCGYYTLTVSTEGTASDLSPVSDCKYGDTVKLVEKAGSQFGVRDIGVIAKQGKEMPLLATIGKEKKNVTR